MAHRWLYYIAVTDDWEVCFYLRDVIDENPFHNCVHESEKALFIQ